ncbi:hypothetical protein SELMODRAFT_146683 [Selaginella moellendorffii]|uniref:protein-serine/threonine phosphatase n=1 Tax=Selaginella moellendorffii TaxID=88036 RepID=D8RFG6_SELML|nr:probable protein phosphatase 2C 59 [Selaginella moellendorffii]XP_002981459.1 probable protein phosphatase 2C 59 [Selaginella moellendorffii]EFJ17647.1 hypothetical protein SELMODRAFT_178894 [Selaginella moellendorffii]EFJ29115.1 hypothetical protein SELMODRAFT_146683 [Selaginella moellendorffii]|eukprot:XP_002969991.1 probable protein phosphatase 2C 59 [Selaginella moellendorffii]
MNGPWKENFSGGGFSEDRRFSFGYCGQCGKRASMEDFIEARIAKVDGQEVGLFGVFDGHGGPRAAEFVKKNLFQNVISHPQFTSDIKFAIADTYKQTDDDYLKDEKDQFRDAGTTASTALLVGNQLIVANVGDSRAVMSRAGEAVPLSIDHKPSRLDEKERIESAGGFVTWAGTWRVGGVLAVSRAFGDRLLKQFVVAIPEIKEEVITEDVEFFVIASDGLWDVVTNQEAVMLVKSLMDPESAAKRLTQAAIKKGSMDNVSCIVVRFNHDKQPEEEILPQKPE